jgi:membrane associated rhomboid family serine protease
MIFFFPIGHEEDVVRRRPVVTLGIIALCLVVHAAVFPIVQRQDEERLRLEGQLANFKIEMYTKHAASPRGVLDTLARTNAGSVAELGAAMAEGLKAFWEAFVAGRIVPKDDPDYKRYEAFASDLAELDAHSVFTRFGYRPAHPTAYSIFTALFLHGGLLHLLGNLYFLYLVGANLEDRWGRPAFAGFYLAGGVAAFLVHGLAFPGDLRPAIGASGAVSAAMGAFAVRYWRTRVRFWYFYLLLRVHTGTFAVPAYVVLPLWLAYQVFLAFFVSDLVPVAFHAHIGGFVFGAAFATILAATGVERNVLAPAVERKVEPRAYAPDDRIVRAHALLTETRPDEAVPLLQEVLIARPGDLSARREMLRALLIQARAGEARAEAHELIDRLVESGEVVEAADVFAEAVAGVPDLTASGKAQFAVAQALDQRKDFSAAARAYRNLGERSPDFPLAPKALVAAARLYADRLDDAKTAFALYRRFLERYPADPLGDHVRERMRSLTGGQVVFGE